MMMNSNNRISWSDSIFLENQLLKSNKKYDADMNRIISILYKTITKELEEESKNSRAIDSNCI